MKEHGRCCDRFTNGALIWSIPTMTSAVIIMSFMVQTVSSIGVSRSLRWHQIDEIEPHALEWAVDRLTQMLAIELIASVSGVTIAVQASEKFGRDDVIDARPLQGHFKALNALHAWPMTMSLFPPAYASGIETSALRPSQRISSDFFNLNALRRTRRRRAGRA
jgi:hypothetical protein